MVSKKNRKTIYVDISFTEEAAKAFVSCKNGKTLSKTMLELVSVYKKECQDQEDPGVITAD